ncbi:hypothetical protein Tco_1203635 [Tanacetum coccineum]
MCGRMFHEESEEVEKYVGGLPDMIRGNVMSYQPKTMEKAIEFANDQMDQKSSYYERKVHVLPVCNKGKKIGQLALDWALQKEPGAEEMKSLVITWQWQCTPAWFCGGHCWNIPISNVVWGLSRLNKWNSKYDLMPGAAPASTSTYRISSFDERMLMGCGIEYKSRRYCFAPSRQLKIHEKNYTTHDLELGVVVFAFNDLEALLVWNQESQMFVAGDDALSKKERIKPLSVPRP